MKRIVSLFLSAALLLGLLSACRQEAPSPRVDPPEPSASAGEWTASELAELALTRSGQEDGEGIERLTASRDGETLAAYAENAYQLEDPWEDMAVIRASGASAFEIAVVRMVGSDAAVRAATAFMSYIYARQGDFTGYAPDQANMAASGEILQNGPYAALFICPAPEDASAAVEAALSGEPMPSAPEPTAASQQRVLELKDVLHRLLLEYACPEWDDGICRAWSDQRSVDVQKFFEAWAQFTSAPVPGDIRTPDDILQKYGVTPEQYEVCAYAWWDPGLTGQDGLAFGSALYETAVFRSADEEAARGLEDSLRAYLERRTEAYRPAGTAEELELLEGAAVTHSGTYAALIVGRDAALAALAFPRILEAEDTDGYFLRYIQGQRPAATEEPDDPQAERYPFTQPNKDDMSLYDTAEIRAAWEKGDPSGLSRYDRDIYDAAKQVLDEVLRDGMSDLEKEEEIYRWVVNHVDYDWRHQSWLEETPRESFTPYGGLVNHEAVCLGYATTFQLLCDLAGVECITVAGAAFQSEEDHGWNMVRLNGEWYCVDATWDANARESLSGLGAGGQDGWEWGYFNVTSDEMADSNHQWDYANTPEATATDRGRG